MYLEPSRNSLVHFQVLLGAVHGANLLLLADLPVGEVPDAIAEANFAQLVVVGQKIAESFDLLGVRGDFLSWTKCFKPFSSSLLMQPSNRLEDIRHNSY